MPDWWDVLNGVLAIPLQILGFSLAIWQIRKAVNSAEAAETASKRAESQIAGNMLLVILPQLNQTENNLEWAVSRSDRSAIIHYLGSWRWQAGQLRGHLARQGDSTDNLLTQIQSSIAVAADTKLALQDEATDVSKRTKAALKAIASVTGLVGELTAKNQFEGITGNGGNG